MAQPQPSIGDMIERWRTADDAEVLAGAKGQGALNATDRDIARREAEDRGLIPPDKPLVITAADRQAIRGSNGAPPEKTAEQEKIAKIRLLPLWPGFVLTAFCIILLPVRLTTPDYQLAPPLQPINLFAVDGWTVPLLPLQLFAVVAWLYGFFCFYRLMDTLGILNDGKRWIREDVGVCLYCIPVINIALGYHWFGKVADFLRQNQVRTVSRRTLALGGAFLMLLTLSGLAAWVWALYTLAAYVQRRTRVLLDRRSGRDTQASAPAVSGADKFRVTVAIVLALLGALATLAQELPHSVGRLFWHEAQAAYGGNDYADEHMQFSYPRNWRIIPDRTGKNIIVESSGGTATVRLRWHNETVAPSLTATALADECAAQMGDVSRTGFGVWGFLEGAGVNIVETPEGPGKQTVRVFVFSDERGSLFVEERWQQEYEPLTARGFRTIRQWLMLPQP